MVCLFEPSQRKDELLSPLGEGRAGQVPRITGYMVRLTTPSGPRRVQSPTRPVPRQAEAVDASHRSCQEAALPRQRTRRRRLCRAGGL